MTKHRRSKAPEPEREYDVGYGKPPKQHQFQRGNAGNRKGRRRKKVKNEAETLREAFAETFTLQINGRRKTVTAFEAIVLTLRSKALKGELAPLKVLLGLYRAFGADHDDQADWSELSANDLRILKDHHPEAMEAIAFAEENGTDLSGRDTPPRRQERGNDED